MTADDRDARLGYRLGAEDDEEARAFEEVAAELALSAEPVEPRPEAKAALFAQLAATPQSPVRDAMEPATEVPDPAPGPAQRAAQRRWFQRPRAIVAAAAVAAVVLFAGGAFLGSTLSGTNSYQSQQASALAEINAAPDTQRATAAVEGGGTATLVWSEQLGRSALVANGLPALPGDKTYELWYMRDGGAIPAGTMEPADSGSTWRVLTGDMAAGDTVGVTVEPRGGSDKPTTAPVVTIPS